MKFGFDHFFRRLQRWQGYPGHMDRGSNSTVQISCTIVKHWVLFSSSYFGEVNKGGKFLKKLWYCVDGRVKQDNLVLSTTLIT